MDKEIFVKKASGELEQFSAEKLSGSLKRSGADDGVIEEIIDEITGWIEELNGSSAPPSTRNIYNKAFTLLRRMTNGNAARYKLKNAMMEMGPTGHPFEHFMGEVYRLLGYEHIEVAQVLRGHCLTHEVDVVATRRKPGKKNGLLPGDNMEQLVVECKYYQSTGKNANVQVSLYVHSRMEDIFGFRKKMPEYANYTFRGGIATNTRFSSDAIAYGEYAGLQLLSWDYPRGHGLREIIDRERIFPVTVLTTLTRTQKDLLMNRGIVICRQLSDNPEIIRELALAPARLRKLQEELTGLLR